MSKVYEALQHAHAERDIVMQVRSEAPPPNRIVTRDLQPRRMEREMANLHQGILALLPQTPKPIIQFFGAREGEGVSTVVWEYGCLIAQQLKKSVLIVSDDPRIKGNCQMFERQSIMTLQELLGREPLLNGSIPKVKDHSLYLCGLEGNELLLPQTNALGMDKENWTIILTQFDCVLIDSPPMSISDDALKFCAIVDGVVIVVEAEATRGPVVHSLKDHIVKRGGNILGVVFNKQRHYIPEWVYKNL